MTVKECVNKQRVEDFTWKAWIWVFIKCLITYSINIFAQFTVVQQKPGVTLWALIRTYICFFSISPAAFYHWVDTPYFNALSSFSSAFDNSCSKELDLAACRSQELESSTYFSVVTFFFFNWLLIRVNFPFEAAVWIQFALHETAIFALQAFTLKNGYPVTTPVLMNWFTAQFQHIWQ